MNGSHAKAINIQKEPKMEPRYPFFLILAHRHFQKEVPPHVGAIGKGEAFVVPLDLLTLAMPLSVVSEMESIEVTYRKRKA